MSRAKKWTLFLLIGLVIVVAAGAYFLIATIPVVTNDNGDKCSTNSDIADGPTSQDQYAVAKYEYDFFRKKGMDPEHAAALVGYSDAESGGLKPAVRQVGNQSEAQTGWGLFQVTPIDRLKNFAKNQNIDWKGEKVQCEYAWQELHHAVSAQGNVTKAGPDWIDLYHHGVSLKEWWKLKDVSKIAGIYTDCFGRGAASHYSNNDPHEVRARKWYAKLAGKDGDTGGGNVVDASETGISLDGISGKCENNGGSDDSLNVKGGKLAYFDSIQSYLIKWKDGKSPYNYGGAGDNLDTAAGAKKGTDCSGFVAWVMKHVGINFSSSRPTTITMFHNDVNVISEKKAKAGDLVFFEGKSNPGHVGIYIGNGQMIDDQNRGIIKEKVHASYWPDLQFARVKSSLVPKKFR